MKKIAALLLAVLLVAGICAPAMADASAPPSGYVLSEERTFSAVEVEKLIINWKTGNLFVLPGEGDAIRLTEYSSRTPVGDEQMACSAKKGTLEISSTLLDSIPHSFPDKYLYIYLPPELCQQLSALQANSISGGVQVEGISTPRLSATTASGPVVVNGCSATELMVSSVSGSFSGSNLQADKLSVSTASGAVKMDEIAAGKLYIDGLSGSLAYNGTAEEVNLNTLSGNASLQLASLPTSITATSLSGKLAFTLPKSSSITVGYSTMSGSFSSDFPSAKNKSNTGYTFTSLSGSIAVSAR